MSSISANLCDEISQIITRHLKHLENYFPVPSTVAEAAPENILVCAQRLIELSRTPAQKASFELYQEACECLAVMQKFLETMNQPLDTAFEDTALGQVYFRSVAWRQVAERKYRLSLDEAWDLLAPAVPDHLEDLGEGRYEARWWKPVPVMDLEMLKYTEGVQIMEHPFEPKGLPGGLALRFALTPDPRG